MNKRFAMLLVALFAALATTLLFTSLARAGAPPAGRTSMAAQGDEPSPLAIRAPRRISIPFGIAPILPIVNEGRDVVVAGHGGCSAGEMVTIAISITQHGTGAVATGEIVEPCTGVEQQWQLTAAAIISPSFVAGPADACGTATTRLGDEITDAESWCRAEPALLVELDLHLYLPLVALDTAEEG
jgi:hypothetical protein